MKGNFTLSSELSYSYNWIAESPVRAVADNRYEKQFIQDSIQQLKHYKVVFCPTKHMVELLEPVCKKKNIKYEISYFDECWVFIRKG